jgi:hypothetical protein
MLQLLIDTIHPAAKTVLDIGCNEGTFARALAERGYFVTGIEGQIKYAETAKAFHQSNRTPRLTISNRLLLPCDISSLANVDVVLLLSVHHQWVATHGLSIANGMLTELVSKSRQQFFFSPACMRSKYGSSFQEFKDNDFAAIEAYFDRLISAATGRHLRWVGNVANNIPPDEPLRPLFVIEPLQDQCKREDERTCARQAWLSKSDVFEVPLRQCRIALTQAPDEAGWCYLSASILEAEKDPHISADRSILAKYYNKWSPANWGEIIFPENPTRVPLMAQIPTRIYNPPLPWSDKHQSKSFGNGEYGFEYSTIPESEFHMHGPLSQTMIRQEFKRLMLIRNTLKKNGYNPEIHHDGYIRGYFLIFEGEQKFMITGGQHRAATLGALGHKNIKVKFEPTFQRTYNFADGAQWPLVRMGFYSMDDARSILSKLFSENGSAIQTMIEQSAAEKR